MKVSPRPPPPVASSGLRVMSVEVANCGAEALQLNGYPQVSLFGGERRPLDVAILEGTGGITILDGFNDPPQRSIHIDLGSTGRMGVRAWYR